MICEIIQTKDGKGSGAGPEAFIPGVEYAAGKATRVEMRNIASTRWEEAGEEMLLTSELNTRVSKPYYHLVISWHEHERPTDDQMFDAADRMIKSLGLEEHQIVNASHDDTKRRHIHIIVNTVHPLTGKVWSKSNDHMRVEQACREIEVAQGWSHDRGRFDFDVSEDGAVTLKPNTEGWEAKKSDREAGNRKKSSESRKIEKSTGFETFQDTISDALKARFAAAVGSAYDWQGLHAALGEIGLCYRKVGSGARVGLLGSEEFAKASAFGSKFSITKMEKSFGPYEEPKSTYNNDIKDIHKDTVSISGSISKEDKKATEASTFKMTLLRRIYCNIYLDPLVSMAIQYVDLKDVPPQITFNDRSTVVDHGSRISASKSTAETRATMIAMAKAKGWSSVTPSGNAEFVKLASLEAARAGLGVSGVPADLQKQCDAILEKVKHQEKIDAEARTTTKASQKAFAEYDAALDKNEVERARMAHNEREATAEVRAVLEALETGRDPVRSAMRTVARDLEKELKKELPDRRKVSNPLTTPNADADDRGKIRRITRSIREHDAHELDRMREVQFEEIAALGGWSYSPKHKDGHNDPQGRDKRTYVRGDETIKATRKGAIWVWTNNKSGEAGSVVDLWLSDNAGSTLGDARKAFRHIIGSDTSTTAQIASRSDSTEPRDHTQARRRWEEAAYIGDRRTYAEDRGISSETLKRFPDKVRSGVFGGIYFAHQNIETGDIQGFEQRWEQDGEANKARFAKGGLKSVCILGNPKTALRMVVMEGGLDALALAEIEKRDDTIYVSTGGGFGARTEAAILRLSEGRKVFSGFDNDTAGEAMHLKLKKLLPEIERLAPPTAIVGSDLICKDWLDVLNALKSTQRSLDPDQVPAMPEPSVRAVGKEGGDGEVLDDDPVWEGEDVVLIDDEKDLPATQPKTESEGPDFT